MRKRSLIIIVVLVAIVAGLIYWLAHRHEQSTDDAQIDAHVVPLAANVSGYIIALNVTDNQDVKQGDVIAEIDPRDYNFALDRAKADLASAQAKLAGSGKNFATTKISASQNVSSAEAGVEAAQAEFERAGKELARLQKLGDGARSRTQLDQAVATEKAARSQLADARAKLTSAQTAPNAIAQAQATVQDLQASVTAAQAGVAKAQKNLDDTKILAPVDGRITNRHGELGAYVQPGEQLLFLVQNDYWVVANYKENQLRDMKPGQEVTIKIDAYSAKKYMGKIDSIQNGTGARFSLFPPENATGNFVKIVQRVPVKIVFTERPDAALPIGPGMSVVPTVMTK